MADELIILEDQRLVEINKVAKEKAIEYFNNFGAHRTEYGFRDASEYRYGQAVYLDPATGDVYIADISFHQYYYRQTAEFYTDNLNFVLESKCKRNSGFALSKMILINAQEAFDYYKANRPTEFKWIMAPFKSEHLSRRLIARLRFALAWPEFVKLSILDYKFTESILDVTIAWGANFYEVVDRKRAANSYRSRYENSTDLERFWEKCRGNTPKEIFYPIPEKMIKTLKDASISNILTLRQIYAGYDMEHVAENKDRVVQIINALQLNTWEEVINSEFNDSNFWSVITATHNNKPIFTLQSLLTYLERLDTFQAIGRRDALSILNDYLSMCRQLDIAPKKDTNSLKREHDVVARNFRIRADADTNRQIVEVNKNISKYNYADKKSGMFIRAITDFEDLRTEGIKMDNCVGSYSKRIIEGRSYIFVLRSINHPNDSIITIELNPSNLSVVQQYLSHNRIITNEAQLNLINEWHKHCLKVMRGTVNPERYEKEVYNIIHGITETEIDIATASLIKELEVITTTHDTSAEERALIGATNVVVTPLKADVITPTDEIIPAENTVQVIEPVEKIVEPRVIAVEQYKNVGIGVCIEANNFDEARQLMAEAMKNANPNIVPRLAANA